MASCGLIMYHNGNVEGQGQGDKKENKEKKEVRKK